MKVLIIGGVAAGTKAAAKLKRVNRDADIMIITKDSEISYAGCGLPYYVGGDIKEKEQLIVNTPEKFAALTGVAVRTGVEAAALDGQAKKVTVRNLSDNQEEVLDYDICVISVGASAVIPKLLGAGLPGVFKMRTPNDAVTMRAYINEQQVKRAVVAGGGFIGLEIAENLMKQGIKVTVVDLASQILPNVFDPEMAAYIKRRLQKMGVRILTSTKLEAVVGTERAEGVQTDNGIIPADLVVMSVGIRPNTGFLADSGIEMVKGTIVVDEQMRTSLNDVYAAGDCVMVRNRITGKPQWSAMGSSANYEGRTLAQIIGGSSKSYPGVLGTGVVKLPDLNCGRTGLTEIQAKEQGYQVETVLGVTDDKAHYYPDADAFAVKMIADRDSHKLLGVQVIGAGAVDKMTDIAAVSIAMNAKLEDLENLDLAYAPPFSTAIHPFVQTVYMLLNKLNQDMVSMTPAEYAAGRAKGYKIVDVSPEPGIPGALYVDLAKVNGPVEGLGKDDKILLVCLKGKRSYFLQNRLKHYGYTNTVVLEGARFFNEVKVEGIKFTVSPEDITRVKALGFLQDKQTANCFNGRVITRNGKITAEESKIIAEAAERFGSGEIAMTSRLTIEIQSVPYENIEPLRAFLEDSGLETGGTGSKVRPVVSCKGTTCQYGLIDTFSLSEEIHERFYHGYSQVKLPHKFKIAVGGCPNNCVKPDLNDLGIIGQRVPAVDKDKCRNCAVCHVVESCPIKVAEMSEGKIAIQTDQCNHCGRCLEKCPFDAVAMEENGYKIYIGGRWGKKTAHGRTLDKIFTDREEVMETVEKCILFFRDQGITGERFADTIARIGFEKAQEIILSDELLLHKDENLAAQKHLKGGATC
ncbi:NADH peroxidase [uncultured Roseburia sp.]|uniref:FAD-dependent oxidoreductase n=1 Tax=Brotonthovivens ammoniilytica TaxID=2981725 RepID=A0ABT2TJ57_9FIRM|nr:FAD-dependent oxidoreductase [Brotonthovivens ammoniilytica]MCU6762250.1 FAD-dependent oxidoreductase [Brotonthovivens ammoniilytica]SCI60125.1 NADH peroxidase [uncultured Roseburia sp.]